MRIDPEDRIVNSVTPDSARPAKIILIFFILGILIVASFAFKKYFNKPIYVVADDIASRLDPAMLAIAQRLYKEPCNRELGKELANSLLNQDEYEGVITFYQNTEKRCGSNNDLLPLVVLAQLGSSHFGDAQHTADILIKDYPGDPDVFGWRSQARQGMGDVKGAYVDMQKALSLFPDPSKVALSVYYDLARLAAKMGAPCEAASTLRDYITFDPEQRKTQQLSTLMQTWQTEGSCPSLVGTGTFFLHYDPNAPAIIVQAIINGVPGRMIIDTGASRTYLSQRLAQKIGINASTSEEAIVSTANGDSLVAGGRAETISVGDARASNIPIFIQKSSQSLGEDIDGLLGLSFLGNFRFSFNDGIFELQPLK